MDFGRDYLTEDFDYNEYETICDTDDYELIEEEFFYD